ncbi:MAG: branched-chain amino acid ABC transporter permease [Ilumatobacteraceae bacterium]
MRTSAVRRGGSAARAILLGTLAGVGLLASAAGAATGRVPRAEDSGLAIIAAVQSQVVVAGTPTRSPLEGVRVVVADEAGATVVEGLTAADGTVRLPVPAKATYVVTLDQASLPDGESLIDAAKGSVTILEDLFSTDTKRVAFFTGQAGERGASEFERIMQRLADGMRLGLIIAMCSVGLSLVFGTTGLTNFAHGEMVTFGGMIAFLLNVMLEIPLLVSGPITILAGGLFGLLLNWGIFARLSRRGIGLVSQLVVTVGLSIMLRNAYLFQFGGRTKQLTDYSKQVNLDLGPIGITPRDLTTSILSLGILLAVAAFLQYSRTGKAVRAVSDNVNLASATGIDTRRIVRIVWFAGGALAATGGIFRGLDEQVGFQMGSDLLFLMFAGITLGGLGSAYGALIGGFAVGVFVEMASLLVPTELKNAPALLILIVVLIVRPQGILGKGQRVG